MWVALLIILGVAAALFGAAILAKKRAPVAVTHEEVATTIERFLDGTCGDHDWDDFLHFSIADPYLELVRKKCDSVFLEYPATQKGHYCSDKGTEVLRQLVVEVRTRGREPNDSPEATPAQRPSPSPTPSSGAPHL